MKRAWHHATDSQNSVVALWLLVGRCRAAKSHGHAMVWEPAMSKRDDKPPTSRLTGSESINEGLTREASSMLEVEGLESGTAFVRCRQQGEGRAVGCWRDCEASSPEHAAEVLRVRRPKVFRATVGVRERQYASLIGGLNRPRPSSGHIAGVC